MGLYIYRQLMQPDRIIFTCAAPCLDLYKQDEQLSTKISMGNLGSRQFTFSFYSDTQFGIHASWQHT